MSTNLSAEELSKVITRKVTSYDLWKSLVRLRGRYRYRLLVRADKTLNLQRAVADWVEGVKVPSTVRVYIDIDPQSFL